MSIAPTVERYLEAHGAHYEIVPHRRTGPSVRTADALGVDGDELIKAVVVEDDRHYAAVLLRGASARCGDQRRDQYRELDRLE